jgi:Icc-related predicted phosphoesterase
VRRRRVRARKGKEGLRLFYAADLHGSGLCWRKFVNAAAFYDANALVIGGDLSGKALVPVVDHGDRYVAWVAGEERRAQTSEELDQLERAIRMNGFYPWRATPADVQALSTDDRLLDETLDRVVIEELARWIAVATERLGPTGIRAYVIPGNDDPWAMDRVLETGDVVTACNEQIVWVDGHELLSFGWSNRTPWNTARELDEDEIYRRLRSLADQLEEPANAILNIHVPPFDSGLDTAYELDETLRPVVRGGLPKEIPVGSTAVRQIIEEVQPLLSLHGHIHESRGIVHMGRSEAINPGSDYGSGRLLGYLVDLSANEIPGRQLVQG